MDQTHDTLRINDSSEPISIDRLIDAWRQAHFAAQAAAELGKSWGEERDDDGHSSFAWIDEDGFRGLEGVPAVGDRPLRARLAFDDLELGVVEPGGAVVHRLALAGRTVDEAVRWLGAVAERELGPRRQPARPAPDLPDHPLARGAAFETDAPALAALTGVYDATARMLARIREDEPAFEAARCWPHHFDLASLAVLDSDGDGAMRKTIGVGVTPPDDLDSAGYWYVSPWSRDEPTNAGAYASLPAGRWLDRGAASMAILSLREAGTPEAADGFAAEAIRMAKAALGV